MNKKSISLDLYKKISTQFVITTVITLTWLIAAFINISSLTGRSLTGSIDSLYPFENMNIITALSVNGHSFLTYIYCAMLFSVITSIAICYINNRVLNDTFNVKSIVVCSLLTSFFLVLSFQTINRTNKFLETHYKFGGKTLEEKKAILFGPIYQFSELCKKKMPGKHKALFIHDLENNSRGGNTKATLMYNLLPIDINNIFPGDPDCLVIFAKKMPEISNTILTDYPSLHIFGKFYAIAARKGSR